MNDMMKKMKVSLIALVMALTLICPIKAESPNGSISTYEKNGGDYSIETLTNSFNIFSFNQASGSHIMGPVVSRGDLKDLNGGMMTFGNVDHGIASYIGGKLHQGILGDINNGHKASQYFGSVNSVTDDNSNYFVNGSFFVPKNKIDGVYVDDNYIDWNKALLEINSQSKRLMDASDRVITLEDIVLINGQKVIQIHEGEYVTVQDDVLSSISTIIYITQAVSNKSNTVINFSANNSITMPRFTYTSGLNDIGQSFPTLENGDNGHSIVFNAPSAKEMVFNNNTAPWFGHVVAPNANVKIEGANFNGSLIVANLESKAEGHLWPFNGPELLPLSTSMELTKMINNKRNITETFEFILEVVESPNSKESVKTTFKNLKDKIRVDFNNFTQAGVYKYKLYENQKFNSDGFIMDNSIYHITYEVGKTSEGKLEINDTKITKEKDNIKTEIRDLSQVQFNNKQTRVETTSVSVNKQWIGKVDTFVDVNLLANGKIIDSVRLDDGNQWQHTFEDLPLKDRDGNIINYLIEEVQADLYDLVRITTNDNYNFNVVNTNYGQRDISFEKIWVGQPLDRIIVQLYGNDMYLDEMVVDETMNWNGTFKNLKKYDDSGKEIIYTLKETNNEGYTDIISGNMDDGYVIINTEDPVTPVEPQTRNIQIKKQWLGTELDKIYIDLLANGKKVKTYPINKFDDWTLNIVDLPMFDADGAEIIYSVIEHDEKGYTVTYEGDMEQGFIIINTIEPITPSDPIDPQTPILPKTGMTAYSEKIVVGGLLILLGVLMKKNNR